MEYEIKHDTGKHRFETSVEGYTAYASYKPSDGIINMNHTIVPPPLEGRGIAAALVKAALEYAKANGLKVIPSCSYVKVFIARHPEYGDLAE